MSEAFVVRVDGLTKQFVRGHGHKTLLRALRSIVESGASTRPALDNVSVEFPRGGIVGVIGENGAGKTTLLKTIAGLYLPSAGRIDTNGEVALLAGLGAGMIDDLTVADNVMLYGAVCRIPRSTLLSKFDEILAWAELESFSEALLRTLSTGMRTRLAFAIAMHIPSATVLMDEAFSAGDTRFQEKCDRFFRDAVKAGRTFIIATHNLEFVREFCDRTLWMDKGKARAFGATADVLGKYEPFGKR